MDMEVILSSIHHQTSTVMDLEGYFDTEKSWENNNKQEGEYKQVTSHSGLDNHLKDTRAVMFL